MLLGCGRCDGQRLLFLNLVSQRNSMFFAGKLGVGGEEELKLFSITST